VKEKCRKAFTRAVSPLRVVLATGMSSSSPSWGRGHPVPLMHEEMDVHNPQTQKADCELKSWQRLSQRLKAQFLNCPFAWSATLCTPVWPDVLRMIQQCHIQNYSISAPTGRRPALLFSYFEYELTQVKRYEEGKGVRGKGSLTHNSAYRRQSVNYGSTIESEYSGHLGSLPTSRAAL